MYLNYKILLIAIFNAQDKNQTYEILLTYNFLPLHQKGYADLGRIEARYIAFLSNKSRLILHYKIAKPLAYFTYPAEISQKKGIHGRLGLSKKFIYIRD